MNVPVPLVCLALPLQMSEVIASEAGTGPSPAQGSTGPPEEEVLGGTEGPQGSALGGVTATGEGEEETQGRGGLTQHITGTMNSKEGATRKLGWVQQCCSHLPLSQNVLCFGF